MVQGAIGTRNYLLFIIICRKIGKRQEGQKLNLKKFWDNFEGYVAGIMMMAMSAIVILQVFCRFVLKASLPWSEEVARYLQVWVAFIAGAYGVRRGAHIGIEAFALMLPKKAQKVLTIIVLLVSIFMCAVIAKYGFDIVSTQLQRGQLTPATRIPMGYMYAAIPVGMVFFIIRHVEELIDQIRHFNDLEYKGGLE